MQNTDTIFYLSYWQKFRSFTIHAGSHSDTFSDFPGGGANWCRPLGGNWQYLPKLYMHLFSVPAFSHLQIYPEDTPPNKQTKQNKRLFNVSLLVIENIRNILNVHPWETD